MAKRDTPQLCRSVSLRADQVSLRETALCASAHKPYSAALLLRESAHFLLPAAKVRRTDVRLSSNDDKMLAFEPRSTSRAAYLRQQNKNRAS